MLTLDNDITTELIIQKSRFITKMIVVHSKEQIIEVLEQTKINYPGATHYCYAYILDQVKHCSDDGEPSKTAGMPILNVLESNKLNHILCVVIRYFGGIKLGAGGLVRAYTKAATIALEESTITELELGEEISIVFSYEKIKIIDYILKDYLIIKKEFDENITYQIHIPNRIKEEILSELYPHILNSSIKSKVYIKKEIVK